MKFPDDPTDIFFFDNADLERFDRRIEGIGGRLQQILVIVVDPEEVFDLLRHMESNDPRIKIAAGDEARDDRFSLQNPSN